MVIPPSLYRCWTPRAASCETHLGTLTFLNPCSEYAILNLFCSPNAKCPFLNSTWRVARSWVPPAGR